MCHKIYGGHMTMDIVQLNFSILLCNSFEYKEKAPIYLLKWT